MSATPDEPCLNQPLLSSECGLSRGRPSLLVDFHLMSLETELSRPVRTRQRLGAGNQEPRRLRLSRVLDRGPSQLAGIARQWWTVNQQFVGAAARNKHPHNKIVALPREGALCLASNGTVGLGRIIPRLQKNVADSE
jgi:hypothetical protein